MKVYRKVLVVAMLFIIGCGGSTALRSGKVYLQKNKDYPRAETWLRKAVDEEPDNWQAHLYLALALAEQEKYVEAERAFRRGKELAPEDKKQMVYDNQRQYFVNHYNKGINANSMLDYDTAIEHFEKAVTIDPDDPKGHINLGVVYSQLDDTDKSLDAFRRAVEVDSTSVEGWRNLGITYQSKREYGLARQAFEELAKLLPDDPAVLFGLGDMCFYDQDFEKALEHYSKAAEKEGDDAALQYQIGASYFAIKRYDEAAIAFQKAAALSQKTDLELYVDAMFNLGISYIKTEEYDGAISTLERLLEVEETSEIHEMLGAAYSKKGMKDKAIKEFERAKELSLE